MCRLAVPIFESVAIIGVGLIGSSLARAIRRVNAASKISLADISPHVLERAELLGLGDAYHLSAFVGCARVPMQCFSVCRLEQMARSQAR